MKNKTLEKMKELNEKLIEASDSYYNKGVEIISNYEYDNLFDKLVALEIETGIILPNSVTQNVGTDEYLDDDINNNVPKYDKWKDYTHQFPALSLDKTKSLNKILSFVSDKKCLLSWKLDGLTLVGKWVDGKLINLCTRGNGIIGSDITVKANEIEGIPLELKKKVNMTVRFEGLLSYSDFDRINNESEDEKDYMNPRNLATGTLKTLEIGIAKKRHIIAKAFQVIDFNEDINSWNESLDFLDELGFITVERVVVTKDNVLEEIERFTNMVKEYDYPVDGLVIDYDDIKYGISLGSTGHHALSGIALKWEDEVFKTILNEVEWSPSRTGLLNPVAIFEPVEIEGTIVSRASIHNISVMENLKLEIGNYVGVYKANKIIPQIATSDGTKNSIEIPKICPLCGKPTLIKTSKASKNNIVKTLYCTNLYCSAKLIGRFERFVDKNAFNIKGISSATLEDFMNKGFIKSPLDLFELYKYKEEITSMDGYGQKSYDNIINTIESCKKINLQNFIYSLGIEYVGRSVSKELSKLGTDTLFRKLLLSSKGNEDEFKNITGIGEIIENSIKEWIRLPENVSYVDELFSKVIVIDNNLTINDKLKDLTFVITGSLNEFTNRDEAKEKIESLGGKVSGSVSAKTSYLVNNDIESNSGKNKKAKELNIPIISEKDLIDMLS